MSEISTGKPLHQLVMGIARQIGEKTQFDLQNIFQFTYGIDLTGETLRITK